jgi:uncharacterized protein YjbI with pentapeptide repeats
MRGISLEVDASTIAGKAGLMKIGGTPAAGSRCARVSTGPNIEQPAAAGDHALEAAAPAERLALLLASIDADPDGRLRLPVVPGRRLALHDLRLDSESLRPHTEGVAPPVWWHKDGGASLRFAELRDTDLHGADLSGADLTGADFTGAAMRSATLRGAQLEGGMFADADLSGSDFSGVRASEAQFANALLEDARFAGATLRFAKFSGALLDSANFERADLWAARMDGIDATDALMRGAVLQEANLAGADLTGANLEGAELKKVDLRGAKLVGADLRGATLARADLEDADLTGASLPRVDLSSCNLRHVRLAGAWLESTRFSVEQLGDGLGEELAGEFDAARRGYLGLEQNFRGQGNPEAASWAYRRARRMGKRGAWQAMREAVRARSVRTAPLLFVSWFGDAFAEWLCDYGESLVRVLRAYLVTLGAFAVYYGLTDSLRYTAESGGARVGEPVHDVFELLGFSFLDMCTSGVPDIGLKPALHFVYFVSSVQYVLGVVLIGLFGYVLGNRLRR